MSDQTTVGEPRELMASCIVSASVRVRLVEAGDIHPGDDVQLTTISGPVHVIEVQDGWAPTLINLVVSIPHDDAQGDGHEQRGLLVVPADLEVTMLSAVREGRIRCLLCQRRCLWVFDYATTSSAATAVCEECDFKILGKQGGHLR